MFRLLFLLFALLSLPSATACAGECPDCMDLQHARWIVASTFLTLTTLLLSDFCRGEHTFVRGKTV